MKVTDKHVVITGAAGGIGLAIARRCKAAGARGIVLSDVDSARVVAAATDIGGLGVACDVTNESDLKAMLARAESAYGPVDVFFSNAGVYRPGGEEAGDAVWNLNWNIHVMAHVYAARVLMPTMAQRKEGYFVITSSAAGLLSHVASAVYATTKHAAVAFAEYLAITYGNQGVRISVLCPQAVRTAMTENLTETTSKVDGMLEPEVLAECVLQTMDAEQFLILPHPTVLEYLRRKTADYDRWLSGMRRLKEKTLL